MNKKWCYITIVMILAFLCLYLLLSDQKELGSFIGVEDNSTSLHAAINSYDELLSERHNPPISYRIDPQAYIKSYYYHEHEKYLKLSTALSMHMKGAGSGGACVVNLYELVQAQVNALEMWIQAESENDIVSMQRAVVFIKTNYTSIDNYILLYKILLSRNDHGLKADIKIYPSSK